MPTKYIGVKTIPQFLNIVNVFLKVEKKNVLGDKQKEDGLLLPSWLPGSNYYWSWVPFPKLTTSPTSLPQSGSALLLPSEVTAPWTTPSPQRSCRGPANREMTSDT